MSNTNTSNLKLEDYKSSWLSKLGALVSNGWFYVVLSLVTSIFLGFMTYVLISMIGTEAGFHGKAFENIRLFFSCTIVLVCVVKFIVNRIENPPPDEILILSKPFARGSSSMLKPGFSVPEMDDDNPGKEYRYTGTPVQINNAFASAGLTVIPPWVQIMTRFNVGPRVITITDQEFQLKAERLDGADDQSPEVRRTVVASFTLRYQVIRALAGKTAERFFSVGCKGYEELEKQVENYLLGELTSWFLDQTPSALFSSNSTSDTKGKILVKLKEIFGGKVGNDDGLLTQIQLDWGIAIGGYNIVDCRLKTAAMQEENAIRIAATSGKLKAEIEALKGANLSQEGYESAVNRLVLPQEGGGSVLVDFENRRGGRNKNKKQKKGGGN